MGKITVIGLGPGAPEQLTLAAREALKTHQKIYLRTAQHPSVSSLTEFAYESFDAFYEQEANFEKVYARIVAHLLEAAKKEDILYGVPGHPFVAESTVEGLRQAAGAAGIALEIHPALSFIDVLLPAVGLDPVNGFKLLDGVQIQTQEPDPSVATIITQVYDPLIASQVKLRLMDYYPDEQEIVVVKNAGIPMSEQVETIPLYELDRLNWIDHLTSVYIPRIDTLQKKYYNMNNLIGIMEILRSKEGCPWDQEQDHRTLKPCLVEECEEVLEAIDLEDDDLLVEELGDVLLQVVFHSQIAKERQAFTIHDVIRGICDKLIYRHPHVFQKEKAVTAEEATALWEKMKQEAKGKKVT